MRPAGVGQQDVVAPGQAPKMTMVLVGYPIKHTASEVCSSTKVVGVWKYPASGCSQRRCCGATMDGGKVEREARSEDECVRMQQKG